MKSTCRFYRVINLWIVLILLTSTAVSQKSTINEEKRSLKTYPFHHPNPIPILTSNAKIYPYFKFEGYSDEGSEHLSYWKNSKNGRNDWAQEGHMKPMNA